MNVQSTLNGNEYTASSKTQLLAQLYKEKHVHELQKVMATPKISESYIQLYQGQTQYPVQLGISWEFEQDGLIAANRSIQINSGNASIDGNTITIYGSGTITLKLIQHGIVSYMSLYIPDYDTYRDDLQSAYDSITQNESLSELILYIPILAKSILDGIDISTVNENAIKNAIIGKYDYGFDFDGTMYARFPLRAQPTTIIEMWATGVTDATARYLFTTGTSATAANAFGLEGGNNAYVMTFRRGNQTCQNLAKLDNHPHTSHIRASNTKIDIDNQYQTITVTPTASTTDFFIGTAGWNNNVTGNKWSGRIYTCNWFLGNDDEPILTNQLVPVADGKFIDTVTGNIYTTVGSPTLIINDAWEQ